MSYADCIQSCHHWMLSWLLDGMIATLLNNVFIFLSGHASFDPIEVLRKAISSHAHRKLFGSKTCMVWFVSMCVHAYMKMCICGAYVWVLIVYIHTLMWACKYLHVENLCGFCTS